MSSFIINTTPCREEKNIAQEKSVDWLQKYHGADTQALFEKYAVSPDYISSRHIYAPGVAGIPFKGETLYANDESEKPNLQKRAHIAQEVLEDSIANLYREVKDIPDHINHVSCTHYQSPSVAQKLVVAKEWNDKSVVTHLYHMGCYAALPAIRVADSYIAAGAKHVDNVHTELCSFHLDKDNTTAEQIIMKTLFSDGIIKYSVVNNEKREELKRRSLEIIGFKEVIVAGTDKEMSWKLSSHGFLMTLTRNVPIILAKRIKAYMTALFEQEGLNYDELKTNAIFAIHPGGPRIIELVQKVLELDESQVTHSKQILKERGNMSSATLPHIWDRILEDKTINDKTYVVTVAFGPGLTVTGAILKLCKA